MKVSYLVVALLSLVFAYEAQAQDSRPACNLAYSRCIVTTDWDNSSLVPTCLDKPASSNCMSDGMNYYYADGNCDPFMTHTSCEYFWRTDEVKSSKNADTDRVTCSGTGYCGWRDGSNKSPSNGSSNSSRAKLHSCAVNGHSNEQTYGTSTSDCQMASTNTSINGYCDSSVWYTLCSNAGF